MAFSPLNNWSVQAVIKVQQLHYISTAATYLNTRESRREERERGESMMMSVLLTLLLVITTTTTSILADITSGDQQGQRDKGVLVVNNENYESVLSNSPMLMIYFYDQKCSECHKMGAYNFNSWLPSGTCPTQYIINLWD